MSENHTVQITDYCEVTKQNETLVVSYGYSRIRNQHGDVIKIPQKGLFNCSAKINETGCMPGHTCPIYEKFSPT